MMAVALDIFGALVGHVRTQLGFDCWKEREPEQLPGQPYQLPYVELTGDFDREWTFEEAFVDRGDVMFSVFAVGADQAKDMALQIDNLFSDPATWPFIPINQPYSSFIEVGESGYGLHIEDDPSRTANVVYRYDVKFHVEVNGARQ